MNEEISVCQKCDIPTDSLLCKNCTIKLIEEVNLLIRQENNSYTAWIKTHNEIENLKEKIKELKTAFYIITMATMIFVITLFFEMHITLPQ